MADKSLPANLRQRFQALWQRCLLPGAKTNSADLYDELVLRYAEPGRVYHRWTHVVNCLREFEGVKSLIGNPDVVEMALWFHDAVYTAGAEDNEQRSAELFRQLSCRLLLPALIEPVCNLILITRHKETPREGDESYMVDIDLSSFGAQWPEFLRDSQDVRKEQAHILDSIYYPAHANFLKMLLERPYIFHTDFFRKEYEEPARYNITRLLGSDAYSGARITPV